MLDANVVGLADEVWNQAVTAVVALRSGWNATEDELKAAVRDRLAGYKVPKRVVFVPDIPRTPAGKAQYEWARQLRPKPWPEPHQGAEQRPGSVPGRRSNGFTNIVAMAMAPADQRQDR